MKIFVTHLLSASLILGLSFQAWGLPEPKVLEIDTSGSPEFTIKGDFREMAPDLGATPKIISAAADLKDCAVLGNAPVIEQCDDLKQVTIREYLSDSIVLEVDRESQSGWDETFLFLLDGEGNGHPIGPLQLNNRGETGGATTFSLLLEDFPAGDAGSVQVWKPVSETSEVEEKDIEAPGQPGKPTVN